MFIVSYRRKSGKNDFSPIAFESTVIKDQQYQFNQRAWFCLHLVEIRIDCHSRIQGERKLRVQPLPYQNLF